MSSPLVDAMNPGPPPGQPDMRGTDSTPAEGRRRYDHADVLIGGAVTGVERRVRRYMLYGSVLLALWTAALGTLSWFGWQQGASPAQARARLEEKVDRNFAIIMSKDSARDNRLDRIERLLTAQAYEDCMQRKNSDPDACGRAFVTGDAISPVAPNN